MNTKRLATPIVCLLIACNLNAQTFDSPPQIPVRTMAEWEELQSLVISWNDGNAGVNWLNILTEIVRAAREECPVIILCDTPALLNSAMVYLDSKQVDTTSNVKTVLAPNNSIWVRDYGPNCIYANNIDSLMLVDWLYNRVRPKDDQVSEIVGQHLSLPVFTTTTAPYDLVNTGGNFMTDGMGKAFASKLVFRNNDQIQNGEGSNPNDLFGTSNHTESSIDNILAEYMGIHEYIKMEELPFDGIHHIDMHMKLLDEETLLVGQYPPGTSDGPQIEANLQYVLANHKTSFGRNFKVIRIPMPPHNGGYPPFGSSARYPTYVNALFVNRTVIMPKYENNLDAAARDTFQKYLPGYKIVPVDCRNIISAGGAVHCITKEIGVQDPLLIQHGALSCQDNSTVPAYEVWAQIAHRSGIADAKLYFSTNLSEAWQSVDMHFVMGDTINLWKGNIPKQNLGSTVYYYIEARANNGKSITRPLTAPEGWWSFCVQESSSVNETPVFSIADIYPNPASAITVVPVKTNIKRQAEISLLNLMGQKVADIFTGEVPAGDNNYFFDARNFEPGIYFVEVRALGVSKTSKVVIR